MSLPQSSSHFSEEDDKYLIRFLAKYTPDGRYRSGNVIYHKLEENGERKWPWSKHHTWMSWRNRYVKQKDYFDQEIRRYQKRHGIDRNRGPPPTPRATPNGNARVAFTAEDDSHLVVYLAKHSTSAKGRLGNSLYETLVANGEGKWRWAERHPWRGWRERYRNNRPEFDQRILNWQKRHDTYIPLQTPVKRGMRKRANAHPENEGEDEEPVVKQEEEESSFNPEDDQSVRDATTKGKGKEREMTSEKEKGKEKRRRSDDHTDEDTTDGRNKRRCVDGSEGRSDSVRPELLSLVEAHEEEESMSVAAPGPGQEATVLEDGDQPLLNAEGREEEEEEEEEEDGQGPPASDDYRGEIFESNTEDVAQSGSDTLLAAEKLTGFNDNVEGEAQAMDIDVGLEYSSRPASHEATPTPSSRGVDPSDRQLYPEVLLRAPAADKPSLPGLDPAVLTLNAQIRQTSEQVVPQVPADPETLQLEQQKPVRATQGPTPPTSVMETPLHSPQVRGDNVKQGTAEEIALRPHPSATKVQMSSDLFSIGYGQVRESHVVDQEMADASSNCAAALTRRIVYVAQPNAEAGPSSAIMTTSTPRARQQRRPRLARHESDCFTSLSPSPTREADISRSDSPAERQPKREPPRLDEGAFNNAFSDARGNPRVSASGKRSRPTGIDEDEDEEKAAESSDSGDWPPKRGKSKGQREPVVSMPEAIQVKSEQKVVTIRKERKDAPVIVRTPAARALNALANDEPVQEHHAFSQPSQVLRRAITPPESRPQAQIHHPFSQQSQTIPDPLGRLSSALSALSRTDMSTRREAIGPALRSNITGIDISRVERVLNRDAHLLQGAKSDEKRASSSASSDVLPVASSSAGQRRSAVPFRITPAPHSLASGQSVNSDLLPVASTETDHGNINRCQSRDNANREGEKESISVPFPNELPHRWHKLADVARGNEDSPPEGLHAGDRGSIRVRQSLPTFSYRRNSNGSRFHSNARPSLRRRISDGSINRSQTRAISEEPDPPLSSNDESILLQVGKELTIETMSNNHGFNPEVVSKLWRAAESLPLTDFILCKMREAAEKKAMELLEAHQTAMQEQDCSKDAAASRRVDRLPSRSSPLRNLSPLKYTSMDFEDDDDTKSEYSPPMHSRAGQFIRLVKAGREDEAFAREISRAGARSSPSTPFNRRGGIVVIEDDDDLDESQSQVELLLEPKAEDDMDQAFRNSPSRSRHNAEDEHLDAFQQAVRHGNFKDLEETIGPGSVRVLAGKMLDKILSRTT
ncbi:hypothetical protein AcV5_005538 [Taiwanofungus camphoratus]|nr:hypothetical protein AcV5_005538 [Antrodia cinnamomea]